METKMTKEAAVALLERYSNYDGMGIPNLAGCKEAMKVAVDALKEAFPELAESEDERIRRWLCDYFSSIDKAWIHKDITCIDILRWLEKQKECVSNNFDDVWDEEDCEEIIAEGQKLTPRFKELLKAVCHAWYDRGAKLEKQKEQNLIMANSPQLKEQKQEKFPPYVTGFKGHPDPAGTSDLEEAAKEYASKTLCDPDDGPSTGLAKESFIAGAEWQKEQKPVEIHVDNPNVEKFDPDVKITTSDSSADGKELLYVCNKSYDIGFRDGVACVKSAEWSEEDEKDMAHIIRILDDCYVYGTHDLSKTDHENLVNKLKSLRPHRKPSEVCYGPKGDPDPAGVWKPSKEQMEAFKKYIEEFHARAEAAVGGWNNFDVMIRLYEQLKKL